MLPDPAAEVDTATPALSVVIPVGPGDSASPTLLRQLDALRSTAEVRLVFAGADAGGAAQPEVSSWMHALHVPAGRSSQQNAGAAAASGDWLWFVHVDSALRADTLPALLRFIGDGRERIGFFDLQFDDGSALMRINALGARLRSRLLGLPFGDQALLMPRALFQRLGGFDPAIACGEDHELIWRARRAGVPICAVGAAVGTSARKYTTHGWLKATAWTLRETARQAWRHSRSAAR